MNNRCDRNDPHPAHEKCIGRIRNAKKPKLESALRKFPEPTSSNVDPIGIKIVELRRQISILEEAKKLIMV